MTHGQDFSLRASSPFGGYCEKLTSERHARGDAKAGAGEFPFFRLRVVPHLSSGIVERVKRERG